MGASVVVVSHFVLVCNMDTSFHCTTETGYTFDAVSHQILGSPCADQNTEAVDYGLEARGSGGFALIASAPRESKSLNSGMVELIR